MDGGPVALGHSSGLFVDLKALGSRSGLTSMGNSVKKALYLFAYNGKGNDEGSL